MRYTRNKYNAQNTLKSSFRFEYGATRVKNAILIWKQSDRLYHLVHYDTDIFSFDESLNVKHVLLCSKSSSRAIRQVCESKGMDYEKIIIKGIKYEDFHKYQMSIDLKYSPIESMKVINN